MADGTGGFRDVNDDSLWPEGDDEPFLIDGLLSSSITILAADPGAGKTFLALAYAEALLNGHESFLGHEVKARLGTVAFICTDADGSAGVRRRVRKGQRITGGRLLTLDFVPGLTDWGDVEKALVEREVELVIVDNLLGLPGDPAEVSSARETTGRFMRWHKRHGIATLMLTHTAKPGASGPAQGVNVPFGSRFWTVQARTKSSFTRNNSTGQCLLVATNNDAAATRQAMELVIESPSEWRWVEPAKAKQGRPGFDHAAMADWVIREGQGVSKAELSRRLADEFGCSASSARDWLKGSGEIGSRLSVHGTSYGPRLEAVS